MSTFTRLQRRRVSTGTQPLQEMQESSLLPDRGSSIPGDQRAAEESQVHQAESEVGEYSLTEIGILPRGASPPRSDGPVTVQATLPVMRPAPPQYGTSPTNGSLHIQRWPDLLDVWKARRRKRAGRAPAEESLPALEPIDEAPSPDGGPAPIQQPAGAAASDADDVFTPEPTEEELASRAPAAVAAAVAGAGAEPQPAPAPAAEEESFSAQPDEEELQRPTLERRAPRQRNRAWAVPGLTKPMYKTTPLADRFSGEGERTAEEAWVGGQYVGQLGALSKLKSNPRAVKYLTEQERARYEIRQGKGDDSHLFYWPQSDEAFDTTKMTMVGTQSRAGKRAIFVMTAGGKIYAANEGAEWKAGKSSNEQERWRFNHSSFLWGERVASAGELVFKEGVLVGITDMSGHYRPELQYTRQVVQEFVKRGADIAGVWVWLGEKGGAQGDVRVPAQDLIDYPDFDEARFRERAAQSSNNGSLIVMKMSESGHDGAMPED